MWYRVATGNEGGNSFSWTWSGSVDASGGITAFSGVNTTTPVDVSTSNTGTPARTATASAVTTTQANDEILALYGAQGIAGTDVTLDAGCEPERHAAIHGHLSEAAPTRRGLARPAPPARRFRPRSGRRGHFTATLNSSSPWITHTIALQPAPTNCTSCTWTGGGGNNNWTTGANWSGGLPPATDGSATLTFPSGAARLSNTNDETAGTTFAGIVISGSGYTLAGNQVTLGASGISDSTTSGSSTISLPADVDSRPDGQRHERGRDAHA